MNEEQEVALKKYQGLMRQAEERKVEAGLTHLKREINRLLDRNSDGTPKGDKR
jgi:hypothetical protein